MRFLLIGIKQKLVVDHLNRFIKMQRHVPGVWIELTAIWRLSLDQGGVCSHRLRSDPDSKDQADDRGRSHPQNSKQTHAIHTR